MRKFGCVLAASLALQVAAVPISPAWADDRGWLTEFLEDSLSDAGRAVTITGFTGALSSRATMTQMTIADDQGVWLTLDNVVLDWSRTALLSGEIIINELTVDALTLARLPETGDAAPTPEATPWEFALPDLPVSIDIGDLRAKRLELGPTVLGQAFEGTLAAALHLSGGEGRAQFDLKRQGEAPEGQITLKASYANETGALDLALEAREGQGGILVSNLGIPGAPAAEITLTGQGAIDDFTAQFRMASGGQTRLEGPISTKVDADGTRQFGVRFQGNPAPMFVPEYADFLGQSLAITLDGRRAPSGAITLEAFDVAARALTLEGALRLAADGLPEFADIRVVISDPDGRAVTLPLSSEPAITLGGARVELALAQGGREGWTLAADVTDFAQGDLALAQGWLKGSGRAGRESGGRVAGGTLTFGAQGLAGLEPALAAAIGADLTGRTVFSWREGGSGLRISEIELAGQDYQLRGGAVVAGAKDDFAIELKAQAELAEMARFSALAGRPLSGAGSTRLEGRVEPLSGGFDLRTEVLGQDVSVGLAEVDRLLRGESRLSADLRRDAGGLTLRAFEGRASSLSVAGSGTLSTAQGADLRLDVNWADLSDLGPERAGRLTAGARFKGSLENGVVQLDGRMDGIETGQAEADRLLAGGAVLSGELALIDGAPVLRALDLAAPNLNAKVAGREGSEVLTAEARLADLALFLPNFPGPVTLAGELTPEGNALRTDLRVTGPSGINAVVAGLIGPTPELTLKGAGDAALINPFSDPVTLSGGLSYDLRVSGAWALANISGEARLNGAHIAIPARGLALENADMRVTLAAARAEVQAEATVPRGGRVRLSGPVQLSAPYAADLGLAVENVLLRDPELYATRVGANLRLAGPLQGRATLTGQVILDETELRVPSTGMASGADLAAFAHQQASAPVRATLARAGAGVDAPAATDTTAGNSLPDWGLDLDILAPRQVFVRGRGLDAELSGGLRLGGTLNAIVPSGGLSLVRGRLDILGKRLTLSDASLQMEGSFVPYVSFAASNIGREVTTTVALEGPATEPEVTFSSDPEMAQEEVLAYLLFDRGLDTISAFQAAQLANAVATLAGRGGEGLVNKLRRGFGFDDLDVKTDAEGQTSVSAGKYVAENIYTEIGVGADGNSRVNLNLDVSTSVTVKGRVDTDGSSGLGVFWERDY